MSLRGRGWASGTSDRQKSWVLLFPWSETFSPPALTTSSVQVGQAEKHQHSRYFTTAQDAGPEFPARRVLME